MKRKKIDWEFDASQYHLCSETMQKTDDRIIRRAELLRMCGLSKSTVWRRIKEGKFPAPVSLGARAVGWRESEVRSYLANLPRRRCSTSPPV